MVREAVPQPPDRRAPQPELHKLIRCNARNAEDEPAVRFVDLDCFALWEHMMRTRHGFRILDYSLCLWIPGREFEHSRDLYLHSGNVEPVSRFDISIFDDVNHYTYAVSRFVLERERDRFRDILLRHVPPEVQHSERFALALTSGYCVEKEQSPDLGRFVLGLYSATHHEL